MRTFEPTSVGSWAQSWKDESKWQYQHPRFIIEIVKNELGHYYYTFCKADDDPNESELWILEATKPRAAMEEAMRRVRNLVSDFQSHLQKSLDTFQEEG